MFKEKRFVFKGEVPGQCGDPDLARQRIEAAFAGKANLEERKALSLTILGKSDALDCAGEVKKVARAELQKYSEAKQKEINVKYDPLDAELEAKKAEYKEHDYANRKNALHWGRRKELAQVSMPYLTVDSSFGHYEGLSGSDKKLLDSLGIQPDLTRRGYMVAEYKNAIEEVVSRGMAPTAHNIDQWFLDRMNLFDGLDLEERQARLGDAVMFLRERGKELDLHVKGQILYKIVETGAYFSQDGIAVLDRAIVLMNAGLGVATDDQKRYELESEIRWAESLRTSIQMHMAREAAKKKK